MGGGSDEDLIRSGHLLQPARSVHDIAHRGVVTSGAERADEDLAGVHADSQVDVDAYLVAHLCEPFLHAKCRPHCPFRVVLVRDRSPEDGDERVADDLVDLATEGRDLDGETLEAAIDQVLDLLRICRLREAREPHQVGEEHGRDAPLVGAGDEAVPARGTEASVPRRLVPTGRASHAVMVGRRAP